MRVETKVWGDYKKLPEEIPEFPLIRRMLLGAVTVVQTPRLRVFETNERRVAKFSETMDPCLWTGMPQCYSLRDILIQIKRREGA